MTKNNEKLFALAGYLFLIPAIYVILTDSQREKYQRHHADEAFMMWLMFFTVFFSLRLFINTIWAFRFFPVLEKLELLAYLGMAVYVFIRGKALFA